MNRTVDVDGALTKEQIKNLRSGDEITWKDPDDGNCSKTASLRKIEVKGDMVKIYWLDGEYTEAFLSELS